MTILVNYTMTLKKQSSVNRSLTVELIRFRMNLEVIIPSYKCPMLALSFSQANVSIITLSAVRELFSRIRILLGVAVKIVLSPWVGIN